MDEKSGYPGMDLDGYQTKDFNKSATSVDPMVMPQQTPKMSKARIIKNLVVVSLGFLCLFTSFQSLSNLQSSLNKADGLGVGGLATIYGALVVSCMFLPPFLIARLGCKWTVAFSMLCYILYMGANFYAVWGTIIPTAIILGLGGAPLWSAKCTYLTETGVWYSKQTGQSEDDIINRFFGVFFMIFQSSKLIFVIDPFYVEWTLLKQRRNEMAKTSHYVFNLLHMLNEISMLLTSAGKSFFTWRLSKC